MRSTFRSTRTRPFAGRTLALGTVLVLAAPAPARAQGGQAPGPRHIVVDGDLWLQSPADVRKAFLVGMGNMLALETAYARKKGTPEPAAGAMTTRAIERMSLDQVSGRITRWYEANPTRHNVPVIGVIWIDMVQPTTTSR